MNPIEQLETSIENATRWEVPIELPPLPNGHGRSLVVEFYLDNAHKWAEAGLHYEVGGSVATLIRLEETPPSLVAELVGVSVKQAPPTAEEVLPELVEALRELTQAVKDEFAASHPLSEAADRASAVLTKATTIQQP